MKPIVWQESAPSFILFQVRQYTHAQIQPRQAASSQTSSSKRGLSQNTRSESPVSRGGRRTPLTYITDIINNGHLMSLHNNLCTHTQAYYHFPANILLHNLHLSRTHNRRLVISKFSRPLQNCLLRPRRFNGPFISAERNNQCQTRLAQRGNSVGTWEKHGLVSWSNTISFKQEIWQTEN